MRYILLISALLLFLPTSAAQAATPTPFPTPTPEPMYSRTDLLAKIAAKPYHITPMFEDLDMMTKVSDTTLDGTSWGLTFLSILNDVGVQTFFIGILLLLILVFWSRKMIIEKMKKREISPAEAQFRQQYKQFRGNIKEYRQFNRSSRRNRF